MTTPLSKISESIDSNLYEKDYYLWLNNTANLLRQKNLAELALPPLIEEIIVTNHATSLGQQVSHPSIKIR